MAQNTNLNVTPYYDDFDKTKKQIETIETEANKMRNNLNAVYGAMQQTEKLLKLSRGEENGKKV